MDINRLYDKAERYNQNLIDALTKEYDHDIADDLIRDLEFKLKLLYQLQKNNNDE